MVFPTLEFDAPRAIAVDADHGLVLAVRFLDRVGKGIRSAPRDALIADITPPGLRGRAFGFNKAMDKTGGFLGLKITSELSICPLYGASRLSSPTSAVKRLDTQRLKPKWWKG
jgi:hypothetical protein